MLERSDRLTVRREEPALRPRFLLLVGGLRTLVDGSHEPRLVLDAFFLRSLAVAGYARPVRVRPLRPRGGPRLRDRVRGSGVRKLPPVGRGRPGSRDDRPR